MNTRIVGCDDKERLVAYLYGEDSPQERSATEAHLSSCTACASEVASLREVRGHFVDWQAPDVSLGFRVTREPEPRRSIWTRPIPAWAQAAAAVLVLSAGAGLANLDVRYGRDGFTVRTGWNHADAAAGATAGRTASATPVASHPGIDEATLRAALAQTEQKLRAEFAAERQHAQPVSAPLAARAGASDDTLRQVRLLIGESEQRQQRELALRMSQVVHDVDTQRRADLVRIEQNMGQIEGLSGAEAASLREQLNYLVRVSQRR